jgi:choline dehydrogenase-like flavoprotein
MEFDYVIVGGGSAGCALAARLAEDEKTSVCLIENGGDNNVWKVKVPLGVALIMPRKSAQNYAFNTVPQTHLNGRIGYQPRGKGLGGSSAINAMVYIRGVKEDYDHWASLGCEGWSYQDVLPAFKRSQHQERGENEFHGINGPLNVSDLTYTNDYTQAYVKAGVQAGYAFNADFNGASQEGVGAYQVTQKNGERWSAARAYIFSQERANLTVMTDTQVRKILFANTGETPVASGVEVKTNGTMHTIKARKEVILSAGAFGSPQLLMVSGIGPKAHLESLGIDVVVDSPNVGNHLQDHLDYTLLVKAHRPKPEYRVNFNHLYGVSLSFGWHYAKEIKRYLKERKGMVSSNVAEGGGFLRTPTALKNGETVPDIQLHFAVALIENHSRTFHLAQGYSIHLCVLRPKSTGKLCLANKDIDTPPLIDPNFLAHPDDAARMIEGFKMVRKICAQKALADLGGEEINTNNIASDDDAAILASIRERADTIYHPVGTCRMGSDAESVVTPTLKVRGVANLRVVDCSIMPTLIGGNTNAPAMMIGERAFDFIKAGL